MKSWHGGANSSMGLDGEYYPTGSYTYSAELTNWPRMWHCGGWFAEHTEQPLKVSAQLAVGRYGASLSIYVGDCRWKTLRNWKGKSLKHLVLRRKSLAVLYDDHASLVRDALRAYYNKEVYGPRTNVLAQDGTPLATFMDSDSACNCLCLPDRTYQYSEFMDGTKFRACEVRRYGQSGYSSGSSPEIMNRVLELLGKKEVHADT